MPASFFTIILLFILTKTIDYLLLFIYNICNYNYFKEVSNMKRIIAAIICVMLLFGGCAAKTPDVTDANYVGEGQMTILRYLISSNAFIVEEIFIENTLEADPADTITNENGTFAPVTSAKASSYGELKAILESTYTKEAAEKILSEHNIYADIDGKLYINTAHTNANADDYDWSEPEINVISVADGTYELEVAIKKSNGFKHKL